jgi:FkbM family methyltransferase
MKVFFDVGANNGEDSISYARQNPDALVYAFEPSPYLVEHIKNDSSDLKNYKIIQVAVSDYDGISTFNICKDLQGLGSLLDWGKNVKSLYPYFHLEFQEQVEVKVIKLETFIEENNIKNITYFHCDTQGNDLKVLKGLGKYISIIEEGQVEATRLDNSLYEGQNTIDATAEFLISKNFEIFEIEDQLHFNECNIKFKKFNYSL